ncbi:hypothetical protein [Paenibacillus jilunlii]|uniref:hypothetical protein n=1 Tax=Paenibacillus jilunlii TaxID=682956 RepID=UPI00115FDE6D|nr:hypothetical protein [Paenibacillus jilunlii]
MEKVDLFEANSPEMAGCPELSILFLTNACWGRGREELSSLFPLELPLDSRRVGVAGGRGDIKLPRS